MAGQSVNIKLDLRIVCIVLVIIIIGMLGFWRPWQNKSSGSSNRTTTQTGQATIKATPDQYQFNPYYELPGTDQVAAKAKTINDKLKEIGVADKDIKNNASSYDVYGPDYYTKTKEKITNLNLTITVKNKDLAQKVQDYLLTTSPMGSITPYASFSSEKQKSLEDEARLKALADAKSKADQIAATLQVKVGKVASVKDGNNFGDNFPCNGGMCPVSMMADKSATAGGEAKQSLPIQAGENEFTYSITVTYDLL